MSLKENIKENEGFKSHIYQDTRGYPTIGYGFKVSSLSKDELFLNGGKVEPMSKVVADQILEMKLIKLASSVYEAAYKNGLNSLWAKQTLGRAKKVLSGLLDN